MNGSVYTLISVHDFQRTTAARMGSSSETESCYAVLAAFELTMLDSNLRQSCSSISSLGITATNHHTELASRTQFCRDMPSLAHMHDKLRTRILTLFQSG